MRAVIQRVTEANVKVDGKVTGAIKEGLVILVGVEDADTQEDIEWLTKKIAGCRIFNDENGVMNRSVMEIGGGLLAVDTLGVGFGDGVVDGPVDDVGVHGVLLGDGVGDEHAAPHAKFKFGAEDSGKLLRGVDAVVYLESAVACIEGGQFFGAVADDGHALGL